MDNYIGNHANIYLKLYEGKRMSKANENKIFGEILNSNLMKGAADYNTIRLMFYYLYNLAILEGVQNGKDFFNFMYEKSKDFTFGGKGYMELLEKYGDGYNFISKAGLMLSSSSS